MLENKKKFNQKEYDKKNFTQKTIVFKNEEWKEVEEYCSLHGEKKNYLMRKAIMEYIGKSIK